MRGWSEYCKPRPRSQALPTSRRLDSATDLVAAVQALAQRWLETAARVPAVSRARPRSLARLNSFSRVPAMLNLRESCMRENRTAPDHGRKEWTRTADCAPIRDYPEVIPLGRIYARTAEVAIACRPEIAFWETEWADFRFQSNHGAPGNNSEESVVIRFLFVKKCRRFCDGLATSDHHISTGFNRQPPSFTIQIT